MTGDARDDNDDDFERIVAGLELSLPDDLGEWGEDERPDGTDEPDVFDPRMSDPVAEHDDDDEDEDDRFVPPEPGPLPPLDRVSRVAWTTLVGAPAVLLVAVVVTWQLPRTVTALLVLAFVAALVTLLVKRGNSDTGGGPDNGAVL